MSDRHPTLAARLLRTDQQLRPPDPAARARSIATIERALREPRRFGSAISKVEGARGSAPGMPQNRSAVQGPELQLTLVWTDTYGGVHPEAAAPHEQSRATTMTTSIDQCPRSGVGAANVAFASSVGAPSAARLPD